MGYEQYSHYSDVRSWVFRDHTTLKHSLSIKTSVCMEHCIPSFGLADVIPRGVIEEHDKCPSWRRVILTDDRHVSRIFEGSGNFSSRGESFQSVEVMAGKD